MRRSARSNSHFVTLSFCISLVSLLIRFFVGFNSRGLSRSLSRIQWLLSQDLSNTGCCPEALTIRSRSTSHYSLSLCGALPWLHFLPCGALGFGPPGRRVRWSSSAFQFWELHGPLFFWDQPGAMVLGVTPCNSTFMYSCPRRNGLLVVLRISRSVNMLEMDGKPAVCRHLRDLWPYQTRELSCAGSPALSDYGPWSSHPVLPHLALFDFFFCDPNLRKWFMRVLHLDFLKIHTFGTRYSMVSIHRCSLYPIILRLPDLDATCVTIYRKSRTSHLENAGKTWQNHVEHQVSKIPLFVSVSPNRIAFLCTPKFLDTIIGILRKPGNPSISPWNSVKSASDSESLLLSPWQFLFR